MEYSGATRRRSLLKSSAHVGSIEVSTPPPQPIPSASSSAATAEPGSSLPSTTKQQLLQTYLKYDGLTKPKLSAFVAELNLTIPVGFDVDQYFQPQQQQPQQSLPSQQQRQPFSSSATTQRNGGAAVVRPPAPPPLSTTTGSAGAPRRTSLSAVPTSTAATSEACLSLSSERFGSIDLNGEAASTATSPNTTEEAIIIMQPSELFRFVEDLQAAVGGGGGVGSARPTAAEGTSSNGIEEESAALRRRAALEVLSKAVQHNPQPQQGGGGGATALSATEQPGPSQLGLSHVGKQQQDAPSDLLGGSTFRRGGAEASVSRSMDLISGSSVCSMSMQQAALVVMDSTEQKNTNCIRQITRVLDQIVADSNPQQQANSNKSRPAAAKSTNLGLSLLVPMEEDDRLHLSRCAFRVLGGKEEGYGEFLPLSVFARRAAECRGIPSGTAQAAVDCLRQPEEDEVELITFHQVLLVQLQEAASRAGGGRAAPSSSSASSLPAQQQQQQQQQGSQQPSLNMLQLINVVNSSTTKGSGIGAGGSGGSVQPVACVVSCTSPTVVRSLAGPHVLEWLLRHRSSNHHKGGSGGNGSGLQATTVGTGGGTSGNNNGGAPIITGGASVGGGPSATTTVPGHPAALNPTLLCSGSSRRSRALPTTPHSSSQINSTPTKKAKPSSPIWQRNLGDSNQLQTTTSNHDYDHNAWVAETTAEQKLRPGEESPISGRRQLKGSAPPRLTSSPRYMNQRADDEISAAVKERARQRRLRGSLPIPTEKHLFSWKLAKVALTKGEPMKRPAVGGDDDPDELNLDEVLAIPVPKRVEDLEVRTMSSARACRRLSEPSGYALMRTPRPGTQGTSSHGSSIADLFMINDGTLTVTKKGRLQVKQPSPSRQRYSAVPRPPSSGGPLGVLLGDPYSQAPVRVHKGEVKYGYQHVVRRGVPPTQGDSRSACGPSSSNVAETQDEKEQEEVEPHEGSTTAHEDGDKDAEEDEDAAGTAVNEGEEETPQHPSAAAGGEPVDWTTNEPMTL